jgi:hypothetical protein
MAALSLSFNKLKMKFRHILSAVFLLLSMTSCITKKQQLSYLWFYTHSSGSADSRDTLLTPASFISLHPDGTYTRDFGSFEYGSWQLKDSQILLTNEKGKIVLLPYNFTQLRELQIAAPNDAKDNFERQPWPGSKPAEDPFSKYNNQWRIRAARNETDQEIRRRLFNHCQFWEAYFTWALNSRIETIDVRSTPTAIKIYGNGFGLKPFEQLPASWKSYFYDSADCQKANDIIRRTFEKNTIAWAHTDNKYKMFIGAFQQLEQFLR